MTAPEGKQMSVYLHRVPGRIRVKSSALRQCDARVEGLCQALSGVAGVTDLMHNPVTGSLLIRYQGMEVEAEIESCLRCLGELPAKQVIDKVAANVDGQANHLTLNIGRTLATSLVRVLSQQLARRLIERALFGAH